MEDGILDMRVPYCNPSSIYAISAKDITGKDVCLSKYKGKVLLIINVASLSLVSLLTTIALSSNTYKELNDLYEKYNDQGLEILAFPCNQFAGQEPGKAENIEETLHSRFQARFPIFQKVDVDGPKAAPLYKYLKDVNSNDEPIKWNFTKFLVNRAGGISQRYLPATPPYKLEEDIKCLLGVEVVTYSKQ